MGDYEDYLNDVETLRNFLKEIDEGKQKQTQRVEVSPSPTIVRVASGYTHTLAKYPKLLAKVNEFINAKKADFNTRFGGSDKPFASGGIYNSEIPGLKHAHLNHDVSIVYNIHGANPRIIDLYGLFSHDDLGTGQPPNRKKQQSRANSFSQERFTNT